MVSIQEAGLSNRRVLESTFENGMDVGILAQGHFRWCKLKRIFWDDMEDICIFSVIGGKKFNWSVPLESITRVQLRDPGFTNEDIL